MIFVLDIILKIGIVWYSLKAFGSQRPIGITRKSLYSFFVCLLFFTWKNIYMQKTLKLKM